MNPTEHSTGVILAAGASGRFAPFKPAALIHGMPMIHHCLAGLYEVCAQIIVVGGNNFEALRSLLDTKAFGPVELVENAGWPAGMFTSVKAGLGRVETGAAFILPVDCPLVPPAVYVALLANSGTSVVPTYQKKRGHPVLIRRGLFEAILREPDESSLRAVLMRSGVVEVEVDAPEVVMDLDTPEDVDQL